MPGFPYSFPFVLGPYIPPSTTKPTVVFPREAELAPVDFGFDILTLPDLDASFTPRRDAAIVADAFLRRLATRRGTIWSDPNYGFYILDYLNAGAKKRNLEALISGIEGQAEQEERIFGISVHAIYAGSSSSLSLGISLVTAAGPFSFVLSVGDVSRDALSEG